MEKAEPLPGSSKKVLTSAMNYRSSESLCMHSLVVDDDGSLHFVCILTCSLLTNAIVCFLEQNCCVDVIHDCLLK